MKTIHSFVLINVLKKKWIKMGAAISFGIQNETPTLVLVNVCLHLLNSSSNHASHIVITNIQRKSRTALLSLRASLSILDGKKQAPGTSIENKTLVIKRDLNN